MRAALIRSASCRGGVPAPRPRPGHSRLMRLGLGLLLVVFTTTGCIRLATYQRPTSRAYSTRSNAATRSKARAPVTTDKPTAPPQGEEEGGRVF